VDPVAHTLAGAALAKAGLERCAPLALPTLLIGANLPDVDVAAYWWGETFALTFRRGWTHGVLALVVLPMLLTVLMLGWDRWVRRARNPAAIPASPRALLLLSALAVASHPLLDLLNVYGIRLLMPFSDRWFYGDVLFIVDPWFWLVLGAGAVLAWRRGNAAPARVAFVVFGIYVAGMAASGLASRWVMARAVPEGRAPAERLMSGPVALTPFRRWVVLEQGDGYRVGEFDWLRTPRLRYDDMVAFPKGNHHPAVAALRGVPEARHFLDWARFPVFRVREGPGGTDVEIVDLRYAVDADAAFGTLTLRVAR
jgi:inner membrane protein